MIILSMIIPGPCQITSGGNNRSRKLGVFNAAGRKISRISSWIGRGGGTAPSSPEDTETQDCSGTYSAVDLVEVVIAWC